MEPITEAGVAEKPEPLAPFPWQWWGRVLYGMFVTVMPIFSFASIRLLKPEWQSGKLSDYIVLLLFPEASWLFFILLAYSVVSYILLLLSPERYSRSFLIRFGIYTGVLLALQYSILSGLYFLDDSSNPFFLLLWILPLIFVPIHRWAVRRWSARTVNSLLILLAVGILVVSAVAQGNPSLILFFPFVLLTIAAPFWSFLLAIRTSFWVLKNYEAGLSLPRGLGLTAWLAGYAAAWRFDILKMYELYAALPPQPPPDCYIATAAAQGHPQVVGSWFVQRTNGKFIRVNRQMQILKCAELALMVVYPQLHKVVRKIYDVVGKALAARLRNPYLADAAYLLLLPWAGLVRWVLKSIVSDVDEIANRLYMN
jgi:hypothetical protein